MKNHHLLWALFLVLMTSEIGEAADKPVLWNYRQLKEIKKDPSSKADRDQVIEYANYCISQSYVVVTDKTKSFCDNPHYYSSIGIYWWPDEKSPTGLPYINKDGIPNPEYKDFDYQRLKMLSKRLKYLSIAYYFTKDIKYYNYYIQQLKAWFINEDTKMLPNFEYAQAIPGRNDNKGRAAGLTEAVEFNTILDSYRLLNACHRIQKPIRKALQEWFSDFSDWMATSEIGLSCSKGNDNTAICYDVLLLNVSLFSGQKERAKQVIVAFTDKRIKAQIDDKGRFPAELKRSKAYYYSVYNLSHIVDFMLLANNMGYDLYVTNKKMIDNAVDYLSQYIGDKDSFKYVQINDWENSEQMLKYQIDRLSKQSKASKRFSYEPELVLNITPSQRLQQILLYE